MNNEKKLNKLILNKAVQLLAQRDHSSYELSQKITFFFAKKQQSTDEESQSQLAKLKIEIQDVIEYCINKNWINDEQYIEKYIVMRANKGYGKYKIAMELKQRGLSVDLSRQLLQMANINWEDLAHQQLLKKLKQINHKNNNKKQKCMQFLISRGYTQDDIKAVQDLLT
ncbi:regulatory protein RecX [Gilliamella sp. ESL0250]|uniref:regulatory protein RecX n=1 Tax=Gilliamella sp. ESL0250 TaxID=2705036 RepID=UPI001580D710|nr:regulatory protein RecX [Gilliamella sp. ESL0250]NUF48306.1 regulatory protein RecX [Gilliamella sp. ESL0250]